MILPLFRKSNPTTEIFAVYNAIVAQSRREGFYARWQVPDTLTGRFDMISLHMALVLRRLRREETAKDFAQSLFDMFFKDMDRSLREMGVGDLSIGKRIDKMGSLFYGMLTKLSEALDSDDPALLEGVIERNIYGGDAAPALRDFADYVRAADARLAGQGVADILGGTVAFEDRP